jgi:hypothetical protein
LAASLIIQLKSFNKLIVYYPSILTS